MLNNIVNILKSNNIKVTKDEKREGYDHGVWIPLQLMYDKADILMIQLSLPLNFNIEELMQLGETLMSLRKNSLVITSGGLAHNLGDSAWQIDAPIKQYAKNFRDWVVEKLEIGEIDSFKKDFYSAPNLKDNHPTLEHILPFLISLGASGNKIGKSLNNTYMYGNMSMDTIIFEE